MKENQLPSAQEFSLRTVLGDEARVTCFSTQDLHRPDISSFLDFPIVSGD